MKIVEPVENDDKRQERNRVPVRSELVTKSKIGSNDIWLTNHPFNKLYSNPAGTYLCRQIFYT